jgi:Na+/proline symporter
MTSHLLVMALFAFLVSVVFATLLKDDVRSQVRTAGWMFGCFMAAGIVLGWLMYPLPL